MYFRWNDWNEEHATKHGVSIAECEAVVQNAGRPYPKATEDDKFLVVGRGSGGRWLQVIFIFSPKDEIYIIHARPLTDREKKRARK